MSAALKQAAQAVLDRWDSPQWEWAKHGPTADLIAELRKALGAEQAQQEPVAEVYRAHYGGRSRNIGFDNVRPLKGVTLPPPGTKLYAAPQQAQATTPEMLRAGQMTEAGGYICATYSGGYTLLTELYAAMAKAAQPVQQVQAPALSGLTDETKSALWGVGANLVQAQAPGWMPIETAPENSDRPVIVFWRDADGEEHRCLDYTEDGCWMEWHNHAEHVEIIGGHGVSYTPPYTHWLPNLPAPQGDKT